MLVPGKKGTAGSPVMTDDALLKVRHGQYGDGNRQQYAVVQAFYPGMHVIYTFDTAMWFCLTFSCAC